MRVYDFISGRLFSELVCHHHLSQNAISQQSQTGTEVDTCKADSRNIEHTGGINHMADDRMKQDDSQRNMGTKGGQQDFGQQTPGRSGQGGQQGGQHSGGQQGGQQSGQQGGQKGARGLDDDEEFGTGQSGQQNRGGQNR